MNIKVNKWLKNIQNALFPPFCVLCGGPGWDDQNLCLDCLEEFTINKPACVRCASPLAGPDAETLICGRCISSPPSFDLSYAVYRYAEPLSSLIQALKFNGKLGHARLLGNLMAQSLEQQLQELPEIIIPVPLHRVRLRERGYNQVLELARPIARHLGIPIDIRSCRRVRNTAVQSLVPAAQRPQNVQGAFTIHGEFTARRIAIVDDVMTTASTVGELTRVLRQAGAEHVQVWLCARTIQY